MESLLEENNIQATKRGQKAAALGRLVIENKSQTSCVDFSILVCSRIEHILKFQKAKKPSVAITTVWKSFHKLRFSSEVHHSWQNLLACLDATPLLVSEENVLCQMLLDRLMKVYISKQRSQLQEDSPSQPTITLNFREKNVVRYIAGYIIRKLKDRYKITTKDANAQQKHERYIRILTRMQTNDQIEYSYEDETCEWTELLDRGGLLHVTSEAYHIFEEIEIKTKSFLKQAGMKQNDPIQGKIISSIMEDSNIMKQWVSTTSDMNDDLLFEIAKLWTTVRCFAFAKNWNDKVVQDKFQKHGTRKTLK